MTHPWINYKGMILFIFLLFLLLSISCAEQPHCYIPVTPLNLSESKVVSYEEIKTDDYLMSFPTSMFICDSNLILKDGKGHKYLFHVLNMKMIVKVGNGEVKPIDSARGSNNSIKKVIGKISDVISEGNYTSLAIAHANCLDKAEKIKEMILKYHKFDEITISEIGSVMGVYAAEGAVLVSVL